MNKLFNNRQKIKKYAICILVVSAFAISLLLYQLYQDRIKYAIVDAIIYTIVYTIEAPCSIGSIISEGLSRNAPTEIFKIKEKIHDYENGSEFRKPDSAKIEYFVISNPPKDTLLLKKIIEEYNFQTMSLDTIKKYSRYERNFYRETQCLTRNYEEGKPYPELQGWAGLLCFSCDLEHSGDDPGQQVRYHYYGKSDFLTYISYSYTSYSGSWRYDPSYGPSIKIKDIDSFYEENRKKLKR